MNDYTYQDILRMQEEAKARVLEMRRRSRFFTDASAEPALPAEPQPPGARRSEGVADHARSIRMPVELPGEKPNASQETDRGEASGPGGGAVETTARLAQPGAKNAARGSTGLPAALRNVFGSLGEEETEKMLILALCLLLSQENGDEGLLLSLLYLLT